MKLSRAIYGRLVNEFDYKNNPHSRQNNKEYDICFYVDNQTRTESWFNFYMPLVDELREHSIEYLRKDYIKRLPL